MGDRGQVLQLGYNIVVTEAECAVPTRSLELGQRPLIEAGPRLRRDLVCRLTRESPRRESLEKRRIFRTSLPLMSAFPSYKVRLKQGSVFRTASPAEE